MQVDSLMGSEEGVSHVSCSRPIPLEFIPQDPRDSLHQDLGDLVVVSTIEDSEHRLVLVAKVKDLQHCHRQPDRDIRW